MKTNLWLPATARDPEPQRQVMHCHLCGEDWPAARVLDFQAHFRRCVPAHRGEIEQLAEEERASIFHWDPDPEVSAHMQRVGDRMIAERRLEVRPNERAGFS